MRRNQNYFSRDKKSKIFPIMLGVTFVSCLITITIAGSYMYTSSSMNKHQKAIEELTLEIDRLEKVTNEIEIQEEEYKKHIDSINQELSKYQPIVIPESMK